MIMLKEFLEEEYAATSVEYGIIVSMVGMAGLVAFSAMGGEVIMIFEDVTGAMHEALE